jgi:hypothetical protein
VASRARPRARRRAGTRAAAATAVTQSTLSASIKELETVLEAPLVDRTRRRGVLPPPLPTPFLLPGKLLVVVPLALVIYLAAVRDLFRRTEE